MFHVVRADPALIEHNLAIEIDMPAVAWIGLDGNEMVGCGGVAWGAGRAWLWFRMDRRAPRYAVSIIRATRRAMRIAAQMGSDRVYVLRDRNEPMSRKLLVTLGFVEAGTEIDRSGVEQEVWTCPSLR